MTGPPGRVARLPKVTVTSARGAPVVTYIKPVPQDTAVQAAYGNGVVNAIVFTDPLVITANPPAKASPGESKAAPTVGDGTISFAPDQITAQPPKPARVPPAPVNEVITFEPEVITAKPPPAVPTRPAPPPKDNTITFAPDTITGRPPGNAPPGVRPPAAKVAKDGTLVFEPDVITARAPGASSKARGEVEAEGADQTELGELAPEGDRPSGPDAVGGNQEKQPGEAAVRPTVPVVKTGAQADETEDAVPPPATGKAEPKPIADAGAVSEEGLPSPAATTKAAAAPGGGGDAAGGGGSEIAAWQQRVSAATAATPQPTLGGAPKASVTVIQGASLGAAARRKAGGTGMAKEAEKAVRKPPETPKQLPPPPPSPVPAADQLITDASDKKLPEQTLPVLKKRTAGDDSSEPVMDTALATDIGSEIAVPKPEPVAPPATDSKKGPDAKQVKKLHDAKKKAPDPGKTAKSGQTMTLKDTAPPPTPGVELGTRGQSKEKVAQVLAELLRSPDEEAGKIVTEARKETYPRNAVDEEYPDLGQEKKDEILTELKTQVESIRVVAGISSKELDTAIQTRNETLKKLQGEAQKDITTARDKAKDETKQDGADAADQIAGARASVDEKTLQTLIAANGEADPQVINMRRDKGLSDLARRAARQDVYYEKSGERRQKALDAASTRMRDAYKNAAKADQKKIYDRLMEDAKKGQKAKQTKKEEDDAKAAATKQAEDQALPFFQWAATQTQELNKQFAKLRADAAAKTKEFRDAIKTALDQAKELVRTWARDKIGEHESWWDQLIRMFREWRQDAQDDSAAWAAARNEALRDSLVGDLNMIDDIHAAAASGVNMSTYIQERGLDQAQAAVLQNYFGGDPKKPRDAIGAVAVGMRMRIRMARKPGMIETFKTQVMAKPDGDWEKLGRIGNAERPPFDVVALASDLFHAMDQWGTDEDKIYAALAHLTPLQARALRARYQSRYHRSLDEHLDSEMSGAELGRAQALLAGNQTLADVETLYEAMHGGLTGWGTDEDAIMRVLRGKSQAERDAIMAEYKKRYGDLKADLKSELDDWSTGSTHDYDRAMALMDGDTAKADAIAVDQAMHGGWTGLGTDEGGITAIYDQNRREVEAEAAQKGWSTKEMEAEIKRRNDEIEKKYESKYGDPKRDPKDKSSLRKAFESEMSDEELDLAVALADNDPIKADAARLEVEKNSFITSDETVNKILASQYQRARRDVERDVTLDLQFRAEVDSLRDKPWDAEKWKQERSSASKKIEEDSAARGKLYMSKLESAYDEKYSKFGKGGLQVLIIFNMSGDDQSKAFDLLKQGGKLEPEQEIFYAVNGIGTDTDKLKEVFKGKSPEEIQKIRDAWHKRYPHEPPLDDRVAEEVSGRDAQDMTWALQGEPQTMEGKLKRAKERMEYEKTAYLLGNKFSKEERVEMEDRYNALETEKKRLEGMAKLKEPKREGESDQDYSARLEKYAYWEDSFKLQEGYFDRAVEDHRTAVDSLADTVATIAAIVATVVVIAVASFFTAGTGGAAILAALASAKVAAAAALAAAAATIATKALLKGSAYSGQEMAIDAVVGIIDAVASFATAGVGGALLKTARTAPVSKIAAIASRSKMATKLAEMAASNRAVTRIFAHGLAEGIEGVAQTLPSALVGNVLDEKNWAKGNPLKNILTGTITATGMAVALSGGLGGLGGISKHADDIAEKLPAGRKALSEELGEAGDILGKRGTPADRLPLWKGWSAENPGRPYKEFLQEFDAGLIAKDADDAARKALQRDLRRELLADIPPAERGPFAGVPIEIMSDADFEKFAKSAKGQAVVIFEDGKPRVILRESADASVLREEGIHLLQSKDPKFAAKFKELDEARLANWKNLDLDEQLRLYKTKLDIEIDGQQRLLKSIDEQLATAEDAAMREALQARRAAAHETLGNLKSRIDEIGAISPLQRMKMARGELKPPQYLEQEPRLFAKRGRTGKWDKELEGVAERRLAAREVRQEVLGELTELSKGKLSAKVSQMIDAFEDIWASYDNRVRGFANRFREFIANKLDPTTLYDVTKSRLAFVETIRGMINPKELDRLDQMLTGVKALFETRGLDISNIDRFAKLAPLLESPRKLFDMVGEVTSLTSFRHKRLPDMADLIEKIAKSRGGGALAEEFGEELTDLAKKTKLRDLVDKVKNPSGWGEAQKALEEAAESLKAKASHFHVPEEQLAPVLEEFARSGRFDWKVFKEGLAEKLKLSDSTFKQLNKVITDVEDAIKAGKVPWISDDVGPLLHWAPVLEKLHDSLGKVEAAKLMQRVKDKLNELLPNLTLDGYKKYRHFLKDEAISYVMHATSPAKQLERLRAFIGALPAGDSASIGEYFASFRRKIFESGKAPAIKGELAGAIDLPLASRQLEGGKRMVDGALQLPEGFKASNGPKEGGRFLVEDKAGKSFDLDQARVYSKALEDGNLKTGDPELAKGLIYFVEDPSHATTIAGKLADNNLDPRIFVATFGPDNTLRFVPRPSTDVKIKPKPKRE